MNLLTEIGKKSDAIGRLKLEPGEKTATLFALEVKENQLGDELRILQADRASKGGALAEAERALASTRAELSQITSNFHESSGAANSQRDAQITLPSGQRISLLSPTFQFLRQSAYRNRQASLAAPYHPIPQDVL
jgi:hypothetical protein